MICLHILFEEKDKMRNSVSTIHNCQIFVERKKIPSMANQLSVLRNKIVLDFNKYLKAI